MKEVRIVAKSHKIDITVPLSGVATLTGGLGGWTTVDRADDLSLTDWNGQEPLTQDVPLLLDGWDRTPRSVERQLNTIFKLGRDFNHKDRERPPVFKVEGPVFYSGKYWVLPSGGIELGTDDTIRLEDGTLVRQSLVLHLLEHVRADVLREHRKSKGIAKRPGDAIPLTYDTRQGDTLMSVATDQFGDWTRWAEIAKKNPRIEVGPFARLPLTTLNL